MTNIPTELLRTLVTVVDLRSFTKAAHALGITQPAVSAQIKRLHALIGAELFDRNVTGVSLTPAGQAVATYARRLLSINDKILQITTPAPPGRMLRLGVTGDYVSPFLPKALANFRSQSPGAKFHVTTGTNERLLHDLRTGELDLVLLLSTGKPERDARHHWMEDMVWGRGPTTLLRPGQPVPLVSRGDQWINHQLAVSALERAGRSYEAVYTGPTILSLMSAVRFGLGVMPFARRRIVNTDLIICDEGDLPPLPSLVCAVYVSELGDVEALYRLADLVADVIRPAPKADRAASPPRVPLAELVDRAG